MTSLLLAIPLAFAAPVPKEFKRESGLDGTWVLTRLEYGGQKLEAESTWRFRGDTLVSRNAGYPESVPTTLRLNPSATPKTFDFVASNQLGLYEVSGDTLTICLGGLPGKRPENFDGGHATFRYTFTRVRDK